MTLGLFYGFVAFVIGLLTVKNHYLAFLLLPLILLAARKRLKYLLLVVGLCALCGFVFMPRERDLGLGEYAGAVKTVKIYDKYVYLKDGYDNYFISYDNYCGTSKCVMKVRGELSELSSTGTPYVSEFGDYLRKQGINRVLKIKEYEIVDAPVNYREEIIAKCTGNLAPPTAEFVKFLVFGKKNSRQELYGDLKSLSILQLFVVSGFHFNILFAAIKKITRRFIKNDLLILAFLFPYLYLLDFTVPALRAFIMLGLRSVNEKYFDERLNNYDILLSAAFFCLFINPWNIYSYSYILTFLINFHLFLIGRVRFKRKIFKGLMSAFVIYLGFIPLLLNLNYELNLFAPIYNLVYGSFMPFLYILAILTCFLNFLEVVLLPLVLGFQQSLSWCVDRSLILIFGKPSVLFSLVYYAAYYYFIYFYEFLRVRKCVAVGSYILLLLVYKYYEPYLLNGESVTYLNVDQGDCALIRAPHNAYNVLIDTGGSKRVDYATTRIIPYLKALGVKKLDRVILSHEDFDHCGALPSLKEHFRVLEETHGNQWEKIDGGSLVFYNLNRVVHDNENDNSSVIVFTLMDKKFLFTGDASSVVEKEIMSLYPDLDVDVLKLGHHGSKTSSCYEFLQYCRPELGIISVGRYNRYGHPHYETLANLHRLDIPYYRTDYDGTVVIEPVYNWAILLK